MKHYVFTVNEKQYDIQSETFNEALQQLIERVLPIKTLNTPLGEIVDGVIFEYKLERIYTEQWKSGGLIKFKQMLKNILKVLCRKWPIVWYKVPQDMGQKLRKSRTI